MYFNYSVYMDIVLQEYTEISWILNTSNTKKIVHHYKHFEVKTFNDCIIFFQQLKFLSTAFGIQLLPNRR